MTTIGFVGLGVMGAPMCRNMTLKHEGDIIAYDQSPSAGEALCDTKACIAASLDEVWESAEVVFLSLPGGNEVEAVCLGAQGPGGRERKPALIVDLSTTSVATARRVAEVLTQEGIAFADCPVARTRIAAENGQLSIMVGASTEDLARVEPMLRHIATDITHCGPVGSGQFVKLVNNALLDVNVIAIAEAMVLAEEVGVDPAVMVAAVSQGSGDSYALRHHAVTSMLPRDFPEKSFPPEYKIKDLSYLLELASEADSPARSMKLALDYYRATVDAGFGGRYFPAVIEVVAKGSYTPGEDA